MSHELIDEMSRIEAIKSQRCANVLTAVKPRRQTVATALAACPADEWVTIEKLFATMRRDNLSPTITRNERSLWKLYLIDPEYGSLSYAGFADWPILEGHYTLCILFEYAATLGLLNVAYTDPAGAHDDFRGDRGVENLDSLSRYDGLRAVRMNALGAYARSRRHLPGHRRDQADTAYAERTSDRVWSLTATVLLAALDTGRSLEE